MLFRLASCSKTLCSLRLSGLILVGLVLSLGSHSFAADASDQLQRGQAIYAQSCAVCHGEQGQGVAGAFGDPLLGDESIGQLAARIERTMPEGEPEDCVGDDAGAVAAYMHHAFYSDAAQLRNRPPRIGLARLTANQLRQSLADLYEQFAGPADPWAAGGVRGIYFDGEHWRENKKKIERVDPVIDFDFGREGPGSGIASEEFYIYWEGAIRPTITGRYDIVLHSTCSLMMDFGRMGRNLVDNHTQSGDKTEFRQSLMLTAGRSYPFKIDYVQRKRKTEQPPASIRLTWVPPNGVEQTIPTENLVQWSGNPTFAVQTVLPADDRSYGYERGTAIDRQWDESTTAAALEFGQIAASELWPAYVEAHKAEQTEQTEQRAQLRAFLERIVSTAFRQPLSDSLRAIYIDKQLAAEADDAEAIKRCLLISLKSPRFLYPAADLDQNNSQRVANRLALMLFDSLPNDAEWQTAIEQDQFQTPEQVREYVYKHLSDLRLRAKTRDMLREWLNVGQAKEIVKDVESYPGFDAPLVDDLRRSLDAMIDDVVWGESSDFRQFFNGNQVYTTPRLAEFYGAAWQPTELLTANQLAKTDSLLPQSHFGVLTHPYLLSRLAYHNASSPIHRGVFLIRYLMGRTLRPPADAFAPLSPDLHPEMTTRERVHLQTSPESCQVCHHKINGLGFTLEHFDAVGRYRAEERGTPINASGTYTSRDDATVDFAALSDLSEYMVSSPDTARAFVKRAFQHFVKQPPAAYGAETLDQLTNNFQESGYNIRELIVDIAVLAATEPVAPTQ